MTFLARYNWLDVVADAFLIQSWSTTVTGPIFSHGMIVAAPAQDRYAQCNRQDRFRRTLWREGSNPRRKHGSDSCYGRDR